MKNNSFKVILIFLTAVFLCLGALNAQTPKFNALVLTERGSWHEEFVVAALNWLTELAKEKNFEFTVINTPKPVTEEYLSNFKVFIQLNYPPYMWNDTAQKAFISYIEKGKGGWVGFHHATLLGEFDGYPMWNWFSGFMGNIRYDNYIADRAAGIVKVEDAKHPVMRGVPNQFIVTEDEWYTYDKSPRPNVHVLANVDESSYQPGTKIKMGDHPVVWINEKMKARNVYFLMGHHPNLLKNEAFKTMVSNAILWASETNTTKTN